MISFEYLLASTWYTSLSCATLVSPKTTTAHTF